MAKRREGHGGICVRDFDFAGRVGSGDDDCGSIDRNRQDGQIAVVRVLADKIDAAGRACRDDSHAAIAANATCKPRGACQFRRVPPVGQIHRRFLFGLNHARAALTSSGVPTSLQNPRMSTACTTRPSAIICAIAPGTSSSPRTEGSSRAK